MSKFVLLFVVALCAAARAESPVPHQVDQDIFQLDPHNIWIFGAVRDAKSNKRLPGARVTCTTGDKTVTKDSNSMGYVWFSVPRGMTKCIASGSGHKDNEVNFDGSISSPYTSLYFNLVPHDESGERMKISGEVKDKTSGQPLSDVKVSCHEVDLDNGDVEGTPKTTTTDTTGVFKVSLRAGKASCTAEKVGYHPAKWQGAGASNSELSVTMELVSRESTSPKYTVIKVFAHKHGQSDVPLPKAAVTCYVKSGDKYKKHSSHTNSAGWASMKMIPGSVACVVSANGFKRTVKKNVNASGGTEVVINAGLESSGATPSPTTAPTGSMKITVTATNTANKKPLDKTTVRCYIKHQKSYVKSSGSSNSLGKLEIVSKPGVGTCVCEKTGYKKHVIRDVKGDGAVAIQCSMTPVEKESTEMRLQGFVKSSANVVPGAKVRCYVKARDGRYHKKSAVTNVKGFFSISSPPGRATCVVEADNCKKLIKRDITGGPGQKLSLTLPMICSKLPTKTTTVRGIVTDAKSNKPLVGSSVKCYFRQTGKQYVKREVVASKTGFFSVTYEFAGSGYCIATAKNYKQSDVRKFTGNSLFSTSFKLVASGNQPGTTSLRVLCRDSQSKTVLPGCKITCYTKIQKPAIKVVKTTGTSDKEGWAALSTPSGASRVCLADANGYKRMVKRDIASETKSITLDMVSTRTSRTSHVISGRLTEEASKQPVAGASIRCYLKPTTGNYAKYSGVSKADGSYSIPTPANTKGKCIFEKDTTRVTKDVSVEKPVVSVNIVLKLPQQSGASVSGVVVDASANGKISGAEVRCYAKNAQGKFQKLTTTTSSTGGFKINLPMKGPVSCVAEKAGYVRTVAKTTGQKLAEFVTIRMKSLTKNMKIVAKLSDSSNKPIPNGEVRCYVKGTDGKFKQSKMATNAQGVATLSTPFGVGTCVGELKGKCPRAIARITKAAPTANVSIQLKCQQSPSTMQIKGMVRTAASGATVSGAELRCYIKTSAGLKLIKGYTTASGGFVITTPMGTGTCVIAKAGFKRGVARNVGNKAVSVLDIKLIRDGTPAPVTQPPRPTTAAPVSGSIIKGRVTDEKTNKGLASAKVRCYTRSASGFVKKEGITLANGFFSISSVLGDSKCVVEKTGYARKTFSSTAKYTGVHAWKLAPAVTRTPVPTAAPTKPTQLLATLVGTTTLMPDRRRLGGITLICTSTTGKQFTGKSVTGGNFAMKVPAGTYKCVSKSIGYIGSTVSVTARAGFTSTLAFNLFQAKRTITVEGSVKDTAGRAVSFAAVNCQGSGGVFRGLTSTTGTYKIQNLKPGTYKCSATKSGRQPSRISDLDGRIQGETHRIEFVIGGAQVAGIKLTGNVRVRGSGGALAGAIVKCYMTTSAGPKSYRAVASSTGTFTITTNEPASAGSCVGEAAGYGRKLVKDIKGGPGTSLRLSFELTKLPGYRYEEEDFSEDDEESYY